MLRERARGGGGGGVGGGGGGGGGDHDARDCVCCIVAASPSSVWDWGHGQLKTRTHSVVFFIRPDSDPALFSCLRNS